MGTSNNRLTTGGGTLKTVSSFLSGVVCPNYQIKMILKKGGSVKALWKVPGSLAALWTASDILKNIAYLMELNNKDYNIYIRPADDRFILLDDLTRDQLEAVAQIKPCLLMETSPGNFQAWLKLRSIPPARQDQLAVWRTLAAMFNADPGSAKPDQIGRLPGFINRKEKYIPNQPLVKLHNYCDRFSGYEYTTAPGAISPNQSSKMTNESVLYTATPGTIPPPVVIYRKPDGGGRSAFDWAITRSLIEQGKTDDEIKTYLLIKSDKAKERGNAYIKHTIRKARGGSNT